jgi:hypothetical protein
MKPITLSILLVFQLGISQKRTCGSAQKMEEIFTNSILKKRYLEQQAIYQKRIIENSNNANKAPQSTLKIPVAVHFPTGNVADRICLIKLAQSQVDVLNKDFKGINQDISKWKTAQTFYPGINTGSIDVEFVLATKNHPLRTDPNLVNDEPAVTVGYDFGNGSDNDPRWKGYFNFVVKDLEDDILGYSPVGGIAFDGDAVVIDNNAFGTHKSCRGFIQEGQFNLGRTVTHELGHFLNLLHTFGDGNGCNPSNTDNIDDTPKLGSPNTGCPTAGSVDGCETLPALTMNYMDYSDDRCLYMFTEGQASVARNYLNAIKPDLKVDVYSDSPINYDLTSTSFLVYPSPNNGNFTIRFDSFVPEQEIYVYDITGRNVFEKKFQMKDDRDIYFDVSIPNVNSGIYFVLIKNENNPKSIYKFLVE